MGILIESLMNNQNNSYELHEICCDIINFNESIIDIENTYQNEYRSLLTEEIMNEGIKDNLSKVWKAIKKFFSDLWVNIKGIFQKVVDSIVGFGRKIKSFILKLLKIAEKKPTYEDNIKKGNNLSDVIITPSSVKTSSKITTTIDYVTYDYKLLEKTVSYLSNEIYYMAASLKNFIKDFDGYSDKEFSSINSNCSITSKEYIEDFEEQIYVLQNIKPVINPTQIDTVDSTLTSESNIILIKLMEQTLDRTDAVESILSKFKNNYKYFSKMFDTINSLKESKGNYEVLTVLKDLFQSITKYINSVITIVTNFIQGDKMLLVNIKKFYQ